MKSRRSGFFSLVSFYTYCQVKEGEGKDDLLGLPVEPTGLEGAAFQSRVPNDKMTQVQNVHMQNAQCTIAHALHMHIQV